MGITQSCSKYKMIWNYKSILKDGTRLNKSNHCDPCSPSAPSSSMVMTDLLDFEMNAASFVYSLRYKLTQVVFPQHFPDPLFYISINASFVVQDFESELHMWDRELNTSQFSSSSDAFFPPGSNMGDVGSDMNIWRIHLWGIAYLPAWIRKKWDYFSFQSCVFDIQIHL